LLIELVEAFWENLYKDKSGEAKGALRDLESLAKERDSTVQALTLISVDDIAEDVTEIKEIVNRMEGNISEMRTEVRSDLQGVQVSLGLGFSRIERLMSHFRLGGDQSEPKPRGE
jgi:t-SNARE complex subunit (syntaxin)